MPTTCQNTSRARRRLAFFARIGLFGDKPSNVAIQRAMDLEDHWQAYRLVHDCYVARGYIEPRPEGARVRSFEAMPEMATFVAKSDDRIVAVTGVLMDSPELGLPSEGTYGEEIDALRRQQRRVCEITNLAIDPDYRNTPVFSELTRCCLGHARAVNYDDLIIAISPEHARFFRDVLLFEPWGGRRIYCQATGDEVVGMRLDLRRLEKRAIEADKALGDRAVLHDFYFARNPYHELVRRWAIRAAGIFTDVALLRELFVFRSGLLGRLSAKEAAAIRCRWGADTFQQVLAEAAVPCSDGDRAAGGSRLPVAA